MNDELEKLLDELRQSLLVSQRSEADKRQLQRLISTTSELVAGQASSLDVKIASMALREMSKAFDVFAPYRDVRKVTIFGSARTTQDNPIYALTVNTARALAQAGYMVVTGAGPGIMERG